MLWPLTGMTEARTWSVLEAIWCQNKTYQQYETGSLQILFISI